MNNSYENIVFIGLGSNKGDRLNSLQNAVNRLSLVKGVKIEVASSVYESKPFGINEQNNFYNAAVKLKTVLTPIALFKQVKQIEKDLGRTFTEKWGPREIDIDLLLYNDLIFSNDFISLPHKGIVYRDFVLQPLCEIDPELSHPETKDKLKLFLTRLEDKYVIKILPEKLFIPEVKH